MKIALFTLLKTELGYFNDALILWILQEYVKLTFVCVSVWVVIFAKT